jgi:hypothetical protein
MTGALLGMLSLAVLSCSVALLAASLGLPRVADALVATAAGAGLGGFIVTAAFTGRRARRPRAAEQP